MSFKKAASALTALAVAAALFTGCKTEQPATPAPGGIELQDMQGRAVHLAAPAGKIVVLTAGDCEIIYALGAGGAVVGRGEFCDYPAEALEVPAVQSGADTNIEQIIALKPDAVLMSEMAQTGEQIAAIEAAGIPVVVSKTTNIEGVYENIAMCGTLTGKVAEAEALVFDMKENFAAIAAKATENKSGDPKTVYFEVSPLEYGLWAAGTGTFMDEIAGMLGLENIFADVKGWGEISQEQVIERNPDYIVTSMMYFGEGPKPEEEILSRSGWQQIAALREGRVFAANGDEITRPGPRLVNAAQTLYELVYGQG